jgi:hypothetical protein
MANLEQENGAVPATPSPANQETPVSTKQAPTTNVKGGDSNPAAIPSEQHRHRRSRHHHHRRLGRKNRRFLAHAAIDAIGILVIAMIWYVLFHQMNGSR